MQTPIAASWLLISGRSMRTRKPSIASSLSSVPPVWPSPRPDIMGTVRPAAATRGASAMEMPSPTPPVECLSTFAAGMDLSSRRWPDDAMARVSATVSVSFIPLRQTAISQAAS